MIIEAIVILISVAFGYYLRSFNAGTFEHIGEKLDKKMKKAGFFKKEVKIIEDQDKSIDDLEALKELELQEKNPFGQ